MFFSYTDIQIGNNFKNLTLGSRTSITCSVPNYNLTNSSIRWLPQDEQIVFNNSGVLVLETVNYTINGTTFKCSVNSPQLYSPGGRSITITVQGKENQLPLVMLLLKSEIVQGYAFGLVRVCVTKNIDLFRAFYHFEKTLLSVLYYLLMEFNDNLVM